MAKALGTLLLLCCGLAIGAGCASRPQPSMHTGGASSAEDGAVADTAQAYRLGQEGATTPSSDVEFKEDNLPAAPEDIVANPISDAAPGADAAVEDVDAPPAPPAEERAIPVAPSVTAPVAPSVTAPVPTSPGNTILGFRVQLHAGDDRSQAERVAREARTRLAVEVYIQFEAPYYKVRVGDFTDRAAALQLRDRARSYGYPEAWVVTTPVRSASAAGAP